MTETNRRRTEKEIVHELNLKLQAGFRRERNRNIIYTLLSWAGSAPFFYYQQPMMIFNMFLLGVIFLIQALSANDQLKSALRHPRRRLMSNIAALKTQSSVTPPKEQSAT